MHSETLGNPADIQQHASANRGTGQISKRNWTGLISGVACLYFVQRGLSNSSFGAAIVLSIKRITRLDQ